MTKKENLTEVGIVENQRIEGKNAIKNQKFEMVKGCHYLNCVFYKCTFYCIFNSTFSDCLFIDCEFSKTIQGSTFEDSKFYLSKFSDLNLHSTRIARSALKFCNFENMVTRNGTYFYHTKV